MKNFAVLLSFLFAISCSIPYINNPNNHQENKLKYSYLPPLIEESKIPAVIDSQNELKKAEEELNNWKTDGTDFGATAFEPEYCSIYKAGILISEKKAFEYKLYQIKAKSFETQLLSCQKLRDFERTQSQQAEGFYQERIFQLEKDNQRSWLERNGLTTGLVGGFICGAIISVSIMYSVQEVKK